MLIGADQIELRELQRSVGITFVLVTHDQEEALALSDRIAVMSGGRVLQVGQAAQIYESPRSKEVAHFIGTMNFLDGIVCEMDGSFSIVDMGAAGRARAMVHDQRVSVGDTVTVAVRPEKLRIGFDPP